MKYVVAGGVLILGYAFAALLLAAPIYLVVAIFHRGLAVIPSDQGDVLALLAIAALFYIPSLLTAPGRLSGSVN